MRTRINSRKGSKITIRNQRMRLKSLKLKRIRITNLIKRRISHKRTRMKMMRMLLNSNMRNLLKRLMLKRKEVLSKTSFLIPKTMDQNSKTSLLLLYLEVALVIISILKSHLLRFLIMSLLINFCQKISLN